MKREDDDGSIIVRYFSRKNQRKTGYSDGYNGNPPSDLRIDPDLVYDDLIDAYNEGYDRGQRARIADKL